MARTRTDEIVLWIAVAVVFTPGVIALAHRWASAEYFQHGFLVPVVTLLQTVASAGAVAVLHAFGVAVLRDGNVMRLPSGGALFVAEACSGITSLLSLIPVGVLIARFSQTGAWRRIALVASVVPAA